ncbi:MAG: glycosyltransferase family 4 protein [Candidatus Korarchaeota archaeon]|nr:glycosyltransferase family 4 protein [Candidatus Korarchaeota archaeon]
MEKRGLFIAWRVLSTRSKPIARRLRFQLFFIKDRPPYFKSMIKTFMKILKEKPKYVAIQLPQGPLLFLMAVLKKLIRFLLIADVHTYFLIPVTLKEKLLNKPFIRYLQDCNIIFVHNYELRKFLSVNLKKKTIVLRDPLPEIHVDREFLKKQNEIALVFPASFAHDEPIENLIKAFKQAEKPKDMIAKLYITGNWRKQPKLREKYSSKNVIFTGYLSKKKYLGLINGADALFALTTYQYTWQSAATEALALGKPLIASKSKALEEVFTRGTLFVNPLDIKSIKIAIEKILDPDIRKRLNKEMLDLRDQYQTEINTKIRKLCEILSIK